ncbi:MAG: DUF86 domain-containing protein [Bacteroidales bacterium]|nr:DUF86 domain-containing protein [Bacteroidales bacterium]
MIDKSKIAFQFTELEKYLEELESIRNLSKQEFLSDNRNIFSLRYLFQVSIETCINIANHIISRFSLGIPKEYADVFRILGEKEIIPDDLESKLVQMVRFRNRLVHVYWDIDDEIIFDYLQNHLDDFRQYEKDIKTYLSHKE